MNSLSAGTKTQPTEFVGVIQLVNCYIATHFEGKKSTCVSKHPETDIKVAQATAKIFAQNKNIPYKDTLLLPNKSIITIVKVGELWYPAEILVDKIQVLTALGK